MDLNTAFFPVLAFFMLQLGSEQEHQLYHEILQCASYLHQHNLLWVGFGGGWVFGVLGFVLVLRFLLLFSE